MLDLLYTPFTFQAVSPTATHVWRNVPVLGSLSDDYMRLCKSVANRPLPCTSYGSFRQFIISVSDFGTVSMCMCLCEFLTIVTKGVVHGVHKVVIRWSFGVIRPDKVSYGIGHFATCPTATED